MSEGTTRHRPPRQPAGRRRRSPRWHKTAALLPLVVVSGAWSATASSSPELAADPVAGSGSVAAPEVPDEIFAEPASLVLPGDLLTPTPAVTPVGARTDDSGAGSSTVAANGIPTSALLAYRRAAQILNAADPGCNLHWSLLAAIGRVESDHGRFGGNALDREGKARPGIYGIPLDGSGGTARITDTDGGVLDRDPVYDRAVGPMQFIPSTWRLAGVDADQDGAKDPQDVDDAATAAGVYLCAGEGDLSTPAGQRFAVYRYNHSWTYVSTVMSLAAAYAGGDYAAVPDGTPSSTTLVLTPAAARAQQAEERRTAGRAGTADAPSRKQTGGSGRGDAPARDSGSAGGGSGGTSTVHSTPRSDSTPSGGGSGGSGGSDGGGSPLPTAAPPPPPSPTPSPSQTATPEPVKTAKETLDTVAEGTAFCANKLSGKPGVTQEIINSCGQALLGKTVEEAGSLLTGSLAEILAKLGI